MSTSLATTSHGAASYSLTEKLDFCNQLARADLLPSDYYNKPANVLLAVEYGNALGLPPIVAIQQVHIINKKPSASSALISSLVRRAGHRLRVTGDNKSAKADIYRADDPDFLFTVTFTMEDAKDAGLTGNPTWKKFPAAMLKARAMTAVARDACQEALNGVCYTAEELEPEKEYSIDGEAVAVTVQEVAPKPVERKALKAPKVKPEEEPVNPIMRLINLRIAADQVLDSEGKLDMAATDAQTLLRFQDWTGPDFNKVPLQKDEDGTPMAVQFINFSPGAILKYIERYESLAASTQKAQQEALDADQDLI